MSDQTNNPLKSFSEQDIANFMPEMKIGLLSTINEDGLPHLTMISTIRASSSTQLAWGQFTEGLSKSYIRNNPHVAFLVMNLNKDLWRGKATFTHIQKDGPDYEAYNNTPMFRHNAYFGIHTVYYMDLVEQTGKQSLPMGPIIQSAIKTTIARLLSRKKKKEKILNGWTEKLFNKMDNLKFLSYVGKDGYPVIIPIIQAQSFDHRYILFSDSVYRNEITQIPEGIPMAIFGLSLDMTDVLIRGKYQGILTWGGFRCGSVKIDWVYNPMPPVPGQIYPPVKLKPVLDF